MTIPSRPAPQPPQPSTNKLGGSFRQQQQQQNTTSASRYAPATNWDDKPFDGTTGNQQNRIKKMPPPRPPPPKANAILKKSGSSQSVNILSSLFGAKKNRVPPVGLVNSKSYGSLSSSKLPPKLPPPPSSGNSVPQFNKQPIDLLIDFNASPSSSPTLTQISSSDCVSVDSFSSDSNYSSPNNGNTSQAESGFEDDFSTDSLKDPWETVDPFTAPPPANPTQNFKSKPPIAQKPVNIGSTSFYAYSGSFTQQTKTTEVDECLSNGKSIVSSVSVISKPTIIRPVGKSSPFKTRENYSSTKSISLEDSLPMPAVPPPPPPPEYFSESETYETEEVEEETEYDSNVESFGISLYDFEGTHDEDLSFRANERIYLIKQLDDEWIMGRNKRGCEGMFPISYVDIKVPIKNNKKAEWGGIKIKALYNFPGDVQGDLALKENDLVTVLYTINEEWLYGYVGISSGQFPANFIEYIPENLPMMPSSI